jgi:hypothetical protein
VETTDDPPQLAVTIDEIPALMDDGGNVVEGPEEKDCVDDPDDVQNEVQPRRRPLHPAAARQIQDVVTSPRNVQVLSNGERHFTVSVREMYRQMEEDGGALCSYSTFVKEVNRMKDHFVPRPE